MAVDGISYHPADGQASGLGALDHLLGQFGFGAKADHVRNMGGLPARQISAPVFGQIQFTVDESMALFSDVREEDTDLTVFHTPGAPAILGGHTSRVASALGEAALINDENREGSCRLELLLWQDRGWAERLADQRPQIVADPIFVPDGTREQTLHAIGPLLSGVLSNLPAIFARDVAQDGLQVEQHVLVDFGTSKMGTQTLMPLEQADDPTAHLTQAWLGLL